MILRPRQEQVITDVRAAFASGKKSILVVAPCGFGKTVLFSKIAQLSAARNTRICILAHRDSLITQASEKLRACGVQHGIISPGYRSRGELVQVASTQTIVRRLDQYDFDLLIPDEAHHAISPTHLKIFGKYSKAKRLGFTATPCRTNGAGLDSVFDHMVLGPTPGELIEDGYLVEPVTYGPSHTLDLSGVGTQSGDYNLLELANHMDNPRITGDAIAAYSRICPGVPAMAYAVNVKHAQDVATAFCAAGYRAVAVHGKQDVKIIRAAISGLTDGSVQVLVSCNLVSEGTDVPAAVAVIGLRPTRSLALNIQMGSRGLRPLYAPGFDLSTRAGRLASIAASPKPKAAILDHAANVFRFMPVDETHDWTLAGRKKRKRDGDSIAISLRQCPQPCGHTHRIAPRCPLCGYVYPVSTTDPEIVDGELSPIDKIALRRAKWKEVAAARTIEQLEALAKSRGYHPQWAHHIMRERDLKRARLDQGSFFTA